MNVPMDRFHVAAQTAGGLTDARLERRRRCRRFANGASELCDGLDNDCDGQVDEGLPDLDENGILDCVETDTDNDGDPDGIDCAPLDPTIHTGAEEQCDGTDNDCDELTDEDFIDSDGDGLADCVDADDDNDGDPDATDCQPLDKTVSSKVLEACDGADNNCDGLVDEGYPNLDKDGLANCVDDDDDGVTDADDNCALTANSGQGDLDKDGLGDACDDDDDGDGTPDVEDCKPKNPAIHLAAEEACDGLDNDCDEGVDEGFTDTDADGTADCVDSDDDNDGDPDVSDCEPLDAAVSNKTLESCDGADNNCNGLIDEGFPDTDGDEVPDCVDADDDNDGDPDATDCAPSDPDVHHGQLEKCDGADNNCEAGADEGFPDTDGDGKTDCVDPDDDNDGDPDVTDCAPLSAATSSLTDEVCDGFQAQSIPLANSWSSFDRNVGPRATQNRIPRLEARRRLAARVGAT